MAFTHPPYSTYMLKNVFARTLLGMITSTLFCASVQPSADGSLPDVFRSALTEVKAKTSVSVLLPSELPEPIRDAKHAVVDKATQDEYTIGLSYELDEGNAGFAA